MRKIKISILGLQAILYRLFAILCDLILLKLISGEWELAINGSLLLNCFKIVTYYIYHYFWAKKFKLGKE